MILILRNMVHNIAIFYLKNFKSSTRHSEIDGNDFGQTFLCVWEESDFRLFYSQQYLL